MKKQPDSDDRHREKKCEFECSSFMGSYRGKARDVHVALAINWAGRSLLAVIATVAAYVCGASALSLFRWL
jgi:hypothetical protein